MPAVCSNNCAAQIVLGGREALRHPGQIPDRIDRDLDHGDAAVLVHDIAVAFSRPAAIADLQFGQIEPRAGDGDARADIDAFGDFRLEVLGHQMAPRIERDDALRIAPLRKRSDGCGGMGVGEIGTPDRIRARRMTRPARGKPNRSRHGCRSHCDPAARHRPDHRSAFACAGCAPFLSSNPARFATLRQQTTFCRDLAATKLEEFAEF
jgi:hypothetical protein